MKLRKSLKPCVYVYSYVKSTPPVSRSNLATGRTNMQLITDLEYNSKEETGGGGESIQIYAFMQIPVPYGVYEIAKITRYQYHPGCSSRAIQKNSLTLNELILRNFGKKSGEWTIIRKMTRQKEQED